MSLFDAIAQSRTYLKKWEIEQAKWKAEGDRFWRSSEKPFVLKDMHFYGGLFYAGNLNGWQFQKYSGDYFINISDPIDDEKTGTSFLCASPEKIIPPYANHAETSSNIASFPNENKDKFIENYQFMSPRDRYTYLKWLESERDSIRNC